MVAADLLASLRELGAELVLVNGGEHARLRLGSIPLPESLLEEIHARKDEIRAAVVGKQKALETAQAIRERRFPLSELKTCPFLIGTEGEACRRCGASWVEHYAFGELQ